MAEKRVTICVDADGAEWAEDWLSQNRDQLSYVSEQLGCGCCVWMWDLQGTEALLDTLPNEKLVFSEFSSRQE